MTEEEHEVEHILDYRVDKTTRRGMFLVHWKGQSDKNNTWETLEDLHECKDKLRDFYTKQANTQGGTTQSKVRKPNIPNSTEHETAPARRPA